MRRVPIFFVLVIFSFEVFSQEAPDRWSIDEVFAAMKGTSTSPGKIQWIEGGKRFTYIRKDSATNRQQVFAYNLSDNARELVLDEAWLVSGGDRKPMTIGSYEWAADGEHVLVTSTLPARRIKTGGDFGIFNLRTKSFRLLSHASGDKAIIKLSPDGKKIGFVRSNNLFALDVSSGKETQLTFDGSDNVLNGKFDWVYEEEFSIIEGWQWSPDSRRIAFWRLDQTAVPTFPLVEYTAESPHARLDLMKYPKAGDPNSLVQIGIITLDGNTTRWLDLGSNPNIYIPRIKWTTDANLLAVQRLNRAQDTLELMLANANDGSLKTILTEADTAWIETEHDDLRFLKKSKRFIWKSSRDGYTHLYLYNLNGTLERQITQGQWDVTELSGVDENRNVIYFVAGKESPLERHLYSIHLDGTGLKRLTQEPGWHSVLFSPDAQVFINTYSNTALPSQVWVKKADGSRIATLVANSFSPWKHLPTTRHSFFVFKTNDGLDLNGYMLKPADFDASKKYPVLMFVYGAGPQTVTHRWGGRNFLWYQLLAQHGYIIVSIDPRGTDARGKAFRQSTNRQLGLPNTRDILEAAKYLGSLSYIDASRLGIWGWSGGGYHTLMAMTYGAGVFKAGIAVAAVTDFKFYDTIWTERYMGTPQANPEGYRATAPITYASQLRGNLLIVHGTADDNVHWQHIIVFNEILIREGKQFETFFYPGQAHGISDPAAQRHLFTKMTNFILEKL
ncbi:MAG: S9 family peptidase [Bacteroidetes bacterium]|nr:S9 family peptidase [Bacteroidota bacterium]MCW5895220.1 S9 family peptidase [Bacteroidota bacterium]